MERGEADDGSEYYHHWLFRKVTPSGIISTVGGNGTLVAVDGAGNLYISDGPKGRIRKVYSKGIITTFAGGGESRL